MDDAEAFRRRAFTPDPDDETGQAGRWPGNGSMDGEPRPRPSVRWHGDSDPHADRAWLVRDLVPETGKGLASGQWGAGKTFGALDLSACVMTGLPFANRRVERQGGVLFIAPEGAFEIPIRLRGLTESKLASAAERGEIGPAAAGRLARLPFAWIEDCPRLVERNALADLCDVAKEVAAHLREAFELPLALIILDTVAAGAGFEDENSAAETQKVMDALQGLARATGAFVLGVDHFGKSSETGTRGSSAKESAADVVLAFLATRDEAGNVSNTRMALRKLRGGRVGMETPYSLDVVEVGETFAREPITTCVVNWQAPRGAEIAKVTRERWPASLRVFRSVLEVALIDNGKLGRPFGHTGPELRVVDEPAVRKEFVASYPASGDTPEKQTEAKRKAFVRAVRQAQERGLIGSREMGGVDHFWFVVPDDE